MRKNCVLVWAGAQNTIAKNATMIVTTASVFILDSLLDLGLLVFEWVSGWMREGKPLPYGVGCIGFVVRYVDSRVTQAGQINHCGLIGLVDVCDGYYD